MLGLVAVEHPTQVIAVTLQGLRVGTAVGVFHLGEPEVEQFLDRVVGSDGAIPERAGVLDEECLEVGPRLVLRFAALSVFADDAVDIAVAGTSQPRPVGTLCAVDVAVGADHQLLSGHF